MRISWGLTSVWSRKMTAGLGILGLIAFAYGWGRVGALPTASAVPPAPPNAAAAGTQAETPSDYSRRWVAVIHGNEPITREEFGEYLIARHSDKLELLVNKRIIERTCKQKGIQVTQAEIDEAIAADLKGMGNLPLKEFVDKILMGRYHKSLYEWREDVVRPRLLMTKLCRDRIRISEQDYKDAFDAYYGEKVDCSLILFPKGQEKIALEMYAELRKSDADFDRIAKQQASPTLAATAGRIKPIGRHTTGNADLETEAFKLRRGEVSRLIGTPEGTAVLKCHNRIPPDVTKKLETERAALEREIVDKKIQVEMPILFQELKDQAQVKLFMKRNITQEELEQEVKKELQPVSGVKSPGAK
jgi:hypothetical protein